MSAKLPYRFEPKRELGRTGFRASVVGIRGADERSASTEEDVATLRWALEAGLNVLDASPSCRKTAVGRALRDLRLGVFVIDSIERLDRPISSQVDSSLHDLGLKTIDLIVFSGVAEPSDWTRLCRRGGPMQELAVCVSDGKCRFRGISSDSPDVLAEAAASGLVDAIVFPIDPESDARIITHVLPLARENNVGAIGTSRLNGPHAGDAPTVEERVAFALTMDADVVLCGGSRSELLEKALKAAHRFDPLSDSEMARIRRKAEVAVRPAEKASVSVSSSI